MGDAPRQSGARLPLRTHLRLPLVLLAVLAIVALVTLWAPPAGRKSWLLETAPALLGITVLLVTVRRFPMSHFVYVSVFIHTLILIYGGVYTYANTPLGNWVRDTFHLMRNPYDRLGHVALGVFPAFYVREVLLRTSPLRRGGWLYFLVVSVVFAIAAFWELIEWWSALLLDPAAGTAFLGTQGDVWDAQWDMFMALIGALVAYPLLGPVHDRSLERVPQLA